jgi:hypothetical protein
MTQSEKTWTVVGLFLAILLLVLYLLRKKSTTNTSVNIPDASNPVSNFPSRNANNNQLLRVCTYDSGESLSLDPAAVGGHCPPVYTDIAGKTGYLLKDEIIVLPQAGNFSGTPGGA